MSDPGIMRVGLVGRAQAALAERALRATSFAELEGEPQAQVIDRGAEAARSRGAGVLPWNVEAALERYRGLAEAMGVVVPEGEQPAAALAARHDQLMQAVGLKPDPTSDGLNADDAERVAELVLAAANRPMLAANARAVDAGAVGRLVDALLAAR